MKLLLVLILILSGCSHQPAKSPVEIAAPVAIEILQPDIVPEHIIKVEIDSLKGFSAAQEIRFKKIASNVQAVINSPAFKEGILNFTYNSKKQFVSTNDTNEQVAQNVLSKDWKLEYKLEYIAKKPFVALTVGYTYPSVTWIVINSKIFDTYDDADIACNIFHEYGGHKLGRYGHDQSYSKSRDYSVPYGIGSLGEKIYRKMFLGQ